MIKFNMMIERELMKEIDAYRGAQENPPPKAKAIRELIRAGLVTKKPK